MEPSYSQKMIFSMASVHHLAFGNFWIFVTFPSPLVKIYVCVQEFVKFGRFAAEIWRYNDFQNGGRPPCCICCDVIIMYRKTEFNALDIVLNFNIHRFHTFWYTSTITFHRFSLKLPIFAQFSRIFSKNTGKLKCCNPQKAHLYMRPRVLNSRCLTYFYICDLYARWKKFFDCLIDWWCACKKKNWNFPYLPSEYG